MNGVTRCSRWSRLFIQQCLTGLIQWIIVQRHLPQAGLQPLKVAIDFANLVVSQIGNASPRQLLNINGQRFNPRPTHVHPTHVQ
ncbi:hypothetical protein D3C76_1271690 [compost metagenome]